MSMRITLTIYLRKPKKNSLKWKLNVMSPKKIYIYIYNNNKIVKERKRHDTAISDGPITLSAPTTINYSICIHMWYAPSPLQSSLYSLSFLILEKILNDNFKFSFHSVVIIFVFKFWVWFNFVYSKSIYRLAIRKSRLDFQPNPKFINLKYLNLDRTHY